MRNLRICRFWTLIFLTLSLVACHSVEENLEVSDQRIIGTWYGLYGSMDSQLVFNKDGTVEMQHSGSEMIYFYRIVESGLLSEKREFSHFSGEEYLIVELSKEGIKYPQPFSITADAQRLYYGGEVLLVRDPGLVQGQIQERIESDDKRQPHENRRKEIDSRARFLVNITENCFDRGIRGPSPEERATCVGALTEELVDECESIAIAYNESGAWLTYRYQVSTCGTIKALLRNDIAHCTNYDGTVHHPCILLVALATRDASLCYHLEDWVQNENDHQVYKCVEDVDSTQLTEEFCNRLTYYDKQDCLYTMKMSREDV